jgi:hypothetical protein
MSHWYRIGITVSSEGLPSQATVTVYEDYEIARVSTRSLEPFMSWVEVVNEMIDTLPVQLKLL